MRERLPDIPTLLAEVSRAEPNARALTYYRGRKVEGQLNRGELLEAVDRAAGYLCRSKGVARGDRIAVLSHNRLEVPVLLLAAMRLGAAIVPMNPVAPPETWGYVLAHSGARLSFVSNDLRADFPRGMIEALAIDDLLGESGGPLPAPEALGDQMAVVLYTSGTTGDPKGVALSQRNLLANAWSMAEHFHLEQTTQLAVLPLYHAHALGFGLMTSLVNRGHLVFADRFDPFCWADIIRAEDVKVTSVVPSLLPALLQARAHRDKVPTLERILVSSAPLTASLAREFESRAEIPLIQGWGLSEYTNFACCLSPDLEPNERRALLYGDESTCIGAALMGTEVRVVDDDGRLLGEGAKGELQVRGHSTMTSYFREEEATRKAIDSAGWLRTGDEGEWRLHRGARVFFVTGRLKEIIVRGGEKQSPIAIERRLVAALPELEGRCIALGFPHRVHGEEIGAYIEMAELSRELESHLLEAALVIPIELRPKVILIGAAPIPRTHTGKAQRRKLVSLFAQYEDRRGAVLIARV